jgi:hypothetical protein
MKHVILVRREKGSDAGYPSLGGVGRGPRSNDGGTAALQTDPRRCGPGSPFGRDHRASKAAPRTHNDYISNVEGHARAWENSQDICLIPTPVGP